MNRRTRRIELRLSEAEAEFIREKSKGYRSVSQYIRDAVAEFSDTDARRRLELINGLGQLYREYHNEPFPPLGQSQPGGQAGQRACLLSAC